MMQISSDYLNVAREDGIINVHIAPFYRLYNHHHNYWENWYHAYIMSAEHRDYLGNYKRNLENLPDDETGFIIEAVRVDDHLVAIGNVSKQGIALSLAPGMHSVYLSGRVHYKNHGISVYKSDPSKNWHRENFEVTAYVEVSEYEDSYMTLEMHLGMKYLRKEKYRIVTKETVEHTDYFKGFIIDYDFKQVTREHIEELAPRCKYLENQTVRIEPVYISSDASSSGSSGNRLTASENKSVADFKNYSETPEYKAVEKSYDKGKMSFDDTNGVGGIIGGGALVFDETLGHYCLHECNSPSGDGVFAGAVLQNDGDSRLYMYNKSGDVGPMLKFDDIGRFYFEFKDERGLHQWFRITTSSISMTVSEVEDGALTGKFIRFKEDTFYDGAYTSDGEKTEYKKYIGKMAIPSVKIPFPKMPEDNFVHLRKTDDGSFFCGNMSSEWPNFKPHGHGILYDSLVTFMGEFRDASPENFCIHHSKGNFISYSCHKNGMRNGAFFCYYQHPNEVEIEVYRDGKAQDISLRIGKDRVIFINNADLDRQHYGIAKNPFRLTSFEYKNGKWVEYQYGKYPCSLSGVRKILSTPRVTPTPDAPKKAEPKKAAPKPAPAVKPTAVKEPPQKVETPKKAELPKKSEKPFESAPAQAKKEAPQLNETPLSCFKLYNTDDPEIFKIAKLTEKVKDVVIPKCISEISIRAFADSEIESIVIPETVKVLGLNVFRNCKKLKKVVLNASLDRIKMYTFEGCTALESITLPDQFRYFDPYVFEDCDALRTIYAADGCDIYTEALPEGCQVISKEKAPALNAVTAPKTANGNTAPSEPRVYTDISKGFYTVTPDHEPGIGYKAVDIKDLHEVIFIHKDYKIIAFSKSSAHGNDIEKVKKLVLSNDVISLEPDTFVMFSGLEELVLPKSPKFSKLPKNMLGASNKCIRHLEIPNGINEIDPDCFVNCSSLESITVGKSVDMSRVRLPKNARVSVKK